jgi:anti-sigma regulatory factor (Ser/Thr protein kinase)
VEAERNRGLGMFIIKRFVDDVAYERGTSSGNCLRLTKLI